MSSSQHVQGSLTILGAAVAHRMPVGTMVWTLGRGVSALEPDLEPDQLWRLVLRGAGYKSPDLPIATATSLLPPLIEILSRTGRSERFVIAGTERSDSPAFAMQLGEGAGPSVDVEARWAERPWAELAEEFGVQDPETLIVAHAPHPDHPPGPLLQRYPHHRPLWLTKRYPGRRASLSVLALLTALEVESSVLLAATDGKTQLLARLSPKR